jgi:hypothetical protein
VQLYNCIPNFFRGFLTGACLLAAMSVSESGVAMQSSVREPHSQCCQISTNGWGQSNYYEVAESTSSGDRSPSDSGRWRLVRTPNPAGGRDAISVMHTADASDSDLDFAGLMFRCQNDTIQLAVILTRPLAPGAEPDVTITAGVTTAKFAARVVPPGVLVLLPAAATSRANDYERTALELVISVANGDGVIRGVIPLAGLGAALQELRASCRDR